MKKNKYVVYTAIFNSYDTLKDPYIISNEIDYICYTDSKELQSDVWKIVFIDTEDNPSLKNRELKLLYPHRDFRDYAYSLYVDGSIMIKEDLLPFFEKYVGIAPIINFKHPNNDCIFTEIIRCIQQRRGNAEKLIQQYNVYLHYGMPKHWVLSDNKIILRENNSEVTKKIMEKWYWHVVNYSGRDQVCLSYVYYKNNYTYHFFDEDIEKNNYFETWPHTNSSKLIWTWRKFNWFCERKHILPGLIHFLDIKIKPLFLKHA